MKRAAFLLGCCAAAVICAGCGDDSSQTSATDPSIPVTEGFPLYGPGPHWIDGVRSGTVTFDALAVVGVDVNGDEVADLTFQVSGPTTVFRSAAHATDPADLRHRNHLDLEIVSMALTAQGVAFRAGDGIGNFVSDGALFSLGSSDESAAAPELAHDAFAIYFEGEVSGLALHNEAPLLMVADIDRLPPIGNVFQLSGPPLPLFKENGNPSGFQITSVTYTPLDPNRPR